MEDTKELKFKQKNSNLNLPLKKKSASRANSKRRMLKKPKKKKSISKSPKQFKRKKIKDKSFENRKKRIINNDDSYFTIENKITALLSPRTLESSEPSKKKNRVNILGKLKNLQKKFSKKINLKGESGGIVRRQILKSLEGIKGKYIHDEKTPPTEVKSEISVDFIKFSEDEKKSEIKPDPSPRKIIENFEDFEPAQPHSSKLYSKFFETAFKGGKRPKTPRKKLYTRYQKYTTPKSKSRNLTPKSKNRKNSRGNSNSAKSSLSARFNSIHGERDPVWEKKVESEKETSKEDVDEFQPYPIGDNEIESLMKELHIKVGKGKFQNNKNLGEFDDDEKEKKKSKYRKTESMKKMLVQREKRMKKLGKNIKSILNENNKKDLFRGTSSRGKSAKRTRKPKKNNKEKKEKKKKNSTIDEALKNFRYPLLLSIIDKTRNIKNLSKGKVVVKDFKEVIKGFSANSYTPEGALISNGKDSKLIIMLNAQDW